MTANTPPRLNFARLNAPGLTTPAAGPFSHLVSTRPLTPAAFARASAALMAGVRSPAASPAAGSFAGKMDAAVKRVRPE